MNVGIVGAAGYSGEELVRLLLRHPHVNLSCITSRSLVGKKLTEVMPQLTALAPEGLTFTDSDPKKLAADPELDLVFLALPHGVAAEFAQPLVEGGKKVIDLSADFRLLNESTYKEYYDQAHPAPELLKKATYVIPELAKDWQDTPLIACPGCYPTSILVPLIPLLAESIIETKGIVINSCSGVSGAGKKVAEAFIFCERNESAKAYGLPKHRHLSEVEEQLSLAAGEEIVVQFNPHLSPMKRGIASTITVPAKKKDIEALYQTWNKYYAGKPFVNVLPTGTFPDTAHAVGTNRVDIAAVYDPRTENFVITSAEDNLLKGASGQAVQCMNLWLGFEETAGLL